MQCAPSIESCAAEKEQTQTEKNTGKSKYHRRRTAREILCGKRKSKRENRNERLARLSLERADGATPDAIGPFPWYAINIGGPTFTLRSS